MKRGQRHDSADNAFRSGAPSRYVGGRRVPGAQQPAGGPETHPLAAAADLSYAPHPAARNLAMRRTGLIALVVSNQELAAHTTLFSEFVPNVVAGLDNAQYQAVLLLTMPAAPIRRWTTSSHRVGAGYEETLRLLRRRPGIDGLFVSAEAFLPDALAGLKQYGRTVPDDVDVVVFDDGPDQEFADPSTTSVRQPYPKLGRELARIIVELIDSPDLDQQLTLGTSLSVRRSSAPVH